MNALSIRTCFPRWYAESKDRTPEFDDVWDVASPQSCTKLLKQIVRSQILSKDISLDHFYAISGAITEDLIALQKLETVPDKLLSLQYLQFETSITPLQIANDLGNGNIAYDWIHNGFGDRVSTAQEREFLTYRIYDFRTTKISWICETRKIGLQDWLSAFFYYARRWAALYDLADCLVIDALIELRHPSPRIADTVELLTFVLSWASAYKHDSEEALAWLAAQLIEGAEVSGFQKSRLVVSLMTPASRYTSRKPEEWAKWAIENIADQLNPQEKLQILIGLIPDVSGWERWRAEIHQTIREHANHILAKVQSPTAKVLATDQRTTILNHLIFKLHSFGCAADLLDVFCTWYSVPQSMRRNGRILFVMPNHFQGMAYLGQGANIFPFTQSDAVDALCACTNSALGISLTVHGQKSIESVRVRPGVPQYEFGSDLEKALTKHYAWARLGRGEIDWARGMVLLPGYPHPLQAHMQRELGNCLPITASLHEPLPDRAVKSAAIWYSGNDNFSEMEANAVASVLRSSGVDVQLLCGTKSTADDFLSAYADNKFDLFWVAGHGLCDRWDPKSPAVLVGDDSALPIDNLSVVRGTGEGRRLLVLNICDSGASSVLGGMHKVGLAPMLSSFCQAVIGHLWPVDPIIAAGFGVCLAKNLVNDGETFFGAFQHSLRSLRQEWSMFVKEAGDGLEADLVERLNRNDRNLGNIFHWGSPCYFE